MTHRRNLTEDEVGVVVNVFIQWLCTYRPDNLDMFVHNNTDTLFNLWLDNMCNGVLSIEDRAHRMRCNPGKMVTYSFGFHISKEGSLLWSPVSDEWTNRVYPNLHRAIRADRTNINLIIGGHSRSSVDDLFT